MGLRRGVASALLALKNPHEAVKHLRERTFEDTLGDYMLTVLATGALAALAITAYRVGFALYLVFTQQVSVQWVNMLNITASFAAGGFFFTLFAGTVGLFIVQLLTRPWTRHLRFTDAFAVLIHAAAPVLVFGWLSPRIAASMLLWSAVLFVEGIRTLPQPALATPKRTATRSARKKK